MEAIGDTGSGGIASGACILFAGYLWKGKMDADCGYHIGSRSCRDSFIASKGNKGWKKWRIGNIRQQSF